MSTPFQKKMRESYLASIRECAKEIESLSFGDPAESIAIVPADQRGDGLLQDRRLGMETLNMPVINNITSSPSIIPIKVSGYPQHRATPNERIFRFANALVKNKKLVKHSVAAKLIGREINSRFAYDDVSNEWYVFDGYCWRVCPRNEFDTFITDLIYAGTGDVGFALNYVTGIVNLIQKTGQNRLPRGRPGVIPFRNGLFDPVTQHLTPTTPENALTWALLVDYSATAECPNFLAWIGIAVDDDKYTILLLRAWINALLTGRADLQVFLHLIGPGGTGKSTFGRLMFAIVGDENATTTSLKYLERNNFEGANIHRKLLVVIEEVDKYNGSICVLKAMTGQDPLRLERKNQQQEGSFIYGGQTLMTSNERIATTDYTSGIERRRITVEFKRRVTKEERAAWSARGGEQKILFNEAPGIINWALSLDRDQVTEIFQYSPERVQKANLEAARFNNPVMDWMLHCLVAEVGVSTQIGGKREHRINGQVIFEDADERLYPNYLTWCLGSGLDYLSLQRFGNTVVEAATTLEVTTRKHRHNDGTKIEGLRIRRPGETSWLELLEFSPKR